MNKKIIIPVSLISLLIIAIIMWYFVLKPKPTPPEPTPTPTPPTPEPPKPTPPEPTPPAPTPEPTPVEQPDLCKDKTTDQCLKLLSDMLGNLSKKVQEELDALNKTV